MIKHALTIACALVACDPNTLADAGPCGSPECTAALFHEQKPLYEWTRDVCLDGAETDEERLICEQAYTLALLGEQKRKETP
jgi:hypothetical protein